MLPVLFSLSLSSGQVAACPLPDDAAACCRFFALRFMRGVEAPPLPPPRRASPLLDGEGVRRRVGAVAEDRPKVHAEELRHGQLDARALSLERVERAQRLLGREVEPRRSPE